MADLPSFDLSGKTALVTGSARGLGRAIALALANAGADIALGLRDLDVDNGVAGEVEALGRKALRLQMDALDLSQSYRAIDQAIAHFRRIDILVNNVGGGIEGPLLEVSEVDFDMTLDLNVKSSFFIAQRLARHMVEKGGGTIVNMSSQAGFIALPGEGVYCLSKAAVAHMTKCMAVEWGQHGITVNAVQPGTTRTEVLEQTESDEGRSWSDIVSRWTALRRLGRPEDIADIVAFVASDEGRWLTGVTLAATGGAVAAGSTIAAYTE